METMLLVHIAAGGVGLAAGFAALYSGKGSRTHRGAGAVFAYAMLLMCGAGLAVTLARGIALAVNVPAALLTACLVVTALTTLRPPSAATRWLDRGAMVVALSVGVVSLRFGYEALAAGGTRQGMPAFPFLMFGGVGVLAGVLDLRVMRAGGVHGAPRVARHLWRMSFALFIASLSFFLGQADEIPEPLRIYPLLALPVVAVLATMLYWLWRVRVRRTLRGLVVGAGPAEPPARPAREGRPVPVNSTS